MDIPNLKEYILDNNYIPVILSELNCHNIKESQNYFQCGNPDGDNNTAVVVYKDCNMGVVNYTRDLGCKNSFDIFDLIQFYKKINFFESLKWLCEVVEIDYYKDWEEDLPESLLLTKMLMEMQDNVESDIKETPLKPIPETILSYYCNYKNELFYNDNINWGTQNEFEIGYDDFSNCITIPIRDEIGTLVGVKGRLLKKNIENYEQKYIYLEPCGRSKILYGLYKTYNYIKQNKKVYVCESEKGVMQLWSYGIKNSVATGGKKVSSVQIEKLSRLCVDIIFLFDKDVLKEEMVNLAKRFIEKINIYAVIDDKNILEEKESPTDNFEKFNILIQECCKLIK